MIKGGEGIVNMKWEIKMIIVFGKLKFNMCFKYKVIIKWVDIVKKKKRGGVYLLNLGVLEWLGI